MDGLALSRALSSLYRAVLYSFGKLTVVVTATPTSGAEPLAVAFTATPSGGTTPYTYAWTFGDGGTSTSQNPSHTYLTTGVFTAAVTVTDSLSHTAPGSVKVTATASVGPSPYPVSKKVRWG